MHFPTLMGLEAIVRHAWFQFHRLPPHVRWLFLAVAVIGLFRLFHHHHRHRRPLPRPSRPTGPDTTRRAGQVGEAITARALRRVFPAECVWPDVHVAAGGRTSQCDHIVYGPWGLVIVETKHWTGNLTRVGPDRWRQNRAGYPPRFYDSPEAQNAWHCQVVQAVLQTHGLGYVPVYGAIALRIRMRRF